MERYFETFFRFKWPFLLLLVSIPILGAGFAIKQQQVLYQATGTVWTDKPAFLSTATTWDQYISPAQNQADNVNEYLQSNSFALDVLRQTDLRAHLTSPSQTQTTLTDFRKQVSVTAVGSHLLAIRYSNESPKIAQQVVQVIISTFNKEVLSTSTSQSSATLAFYQKQLGDATVKTAEATAALGAYLNAHPDIQKGTAKQDVSQLVASANFAAQHPELVKLIQGQDAATKAEQQLQSQVDQIRFTQSSQTVGTEQSFRVMDPPTVPSKPASNKRKIALELGIAVLIAVGFVVGGVVLFTVLDTTLRTTNDVARRLHLPACGGIPMMKERHGLVRRGFVSRRSVRALMALQSRLPGA